MPKRNDPGHLNKKLFGGGHPIKSRGVEAIVGVGLLLVGCILLWDAFDNRGKPLPWPISKFTPW